MITVDVRQLKQQISELIRMVRKTGNQVRITDHGKVVALLVPAVFTVNADSENHTWDNLDTLMAEIGASWPQGVSAAQAISDARR